ncbi:MAG: XRE family transcriptional regulator [Acutalibacteraceae bacterium]
MLKKPTDELLEQLRHSNTIDSYIKENEEYLIDCSLAEHLNAVSKEKHLVKSQVIKRAELNEIYGYQIFSGKRMPSRDTLLSICIGMGLNTEETQETLKIAGFAPLYPKNKRDSIILFGIENKQNVCAVNSSLFENHEDTL